MKHIIVFILILIAQATMAQSIPTDTFDKVVVSPHIAVTFVQGATEGVEVLSTTVADHKLHIEVNGNTLRIYLDGAKEITKNEKYERNGQKKKRSLYRGTVVTAKVTYKNLDELSLRGEERFEVVSPLVQEDFRLKIYGESQVYVHQVQLTNLHTTIYGESYLELMAGAVKNQRYTVYGESTLNALAISNEETKVTAYGEGSYQLNVNNRLKVTAYGEATVAYTGTPKISTGIVIGEATIQQIRNQ